MRKLVLNTLKYLLFLLIGLIISVNLFILLSGRFYMYKGIANTYLVGKMGPTIYDLEIFPYSTVQAGPNKSEMTRHKNYNKAVLSTNNQEFIDKYQTKALLVFSGDTLLFEKYYDEHNENTVSNSFSVAKTLVALLIGIAVDEGYIKSLDESISVYIPEFKGTDKKAITIRHLLAMASGLNWKESGKNPLSDNAESYYGKDLRGHVTSQSVEIEPGKLFNYQSGNSQLLGFILEKATGVGLNKYAADKIWTRIGAEHDAFWSLDKVNGDEKAFCCIYATARDYGRLGQVILNGGKYNGVQIIPEDYFNEMIVPTDLNTKEDIPNYRYGLHIWTYQSHDGQVNYCRGVNGQYIIAIPDENLLIIRLGSKKMQNYLIPEEKKTDEIFVEQNKYKVGHAKGLFEYISMGKSIRSKTE